MCDKRTSALECRIALLKYFKSVRKIKEATLEELTSVVGSARAMAIQKHFGKE
jgi:excinuclease UvrABC nuclease subunit